MRVYNVSSKVISYRGKDLFPGASINFPELDEFLPDRDKELEKKKLLAFGSLPNWYLIDKETKAQKAAAKPVPAATEDSKPVFRRSKLDK